MTDLTKLIAEIRSRPTHRAYRARQDQSPAVQETRTLGPIEGPRGPQEADPIERRSVGLGPVPAGGQTSQEQDSPQTGAVQPKADLRANQGPAPVEAPTRVREATKQLGEISYLLEAQDRQLTEVRTALVRERTRYEIKRADQCVTLDEWRMRAYHYEAEWSRCSQHCASIQGRAEAAEQRVRELEPHLASLRGLLGDIKLHFQRGDPDDARYSTLSPEELSELLTARCEQASKEGDLIYFQVCAAIQRIDAARAELKGEGHGQG